MVNTHQWACESRSGVFSPHSTVVWSTRTTYLFTATKESQPLSKRVKTAAYLLYRTTEAVRCPSHSPCCGNRTSTAVSEGRVTGEGWPMPLLFARNAFGVHAPSRLHRNLVIRPPIGGFSRTTSALSSGQMTDGGLLWFVTLPVF